MSGRHTADAAPAPETPEAGGGRDSGGGRGSGGRDWKHRAIAIVLLLIALVLAYLAASAYIPRWWSQRIGSAVDGKLSTGALLGFCFGCVFTILPLGPLWITMRRPMRWKMRALWLALAVVLAAPNLMTLGVAVGGGGGAHAGQRTMDVNAPMFRGATAIGALFAIVAFVVMVIVYRRRGRAPQATPPAPAAPTGPAD